MDKIIHIGVNWQSYDNVFAECNEDIKENLVCFTDYDRVNCPECIRKILNQKTNHILSLMNEIQYWTNKFREVLKLE